MTRNLWSHLVRHGVAFAFGASGSLAVRQAGLLRRAARWQPLRDTTPSFEIRPATRRARLLVVGDSTGVGVGTEHGLSLPGLLAAEFDRLEIVNRCRSGARVGELREQAKPLLAGERFDLALVVAGGNDVLRTTPGLELEEACTDLLQDLGRVADRVVWLGCADVGSAPALLAPVSWWFSWRSRRVSAVIHRAAKGAGAQFVDFSTAEHRKRFEASPRTFFAPDGLHPSSAAYRYCFEFLKRCLQRSGVPTEAWRSPPSTGRATV